MNKPKVALAVLLTALVIITTYGSSKSPEQTAKSPSAPAAASVHNDAVFQRVAPVPAISGTLRLVPGEPTYTMTLSADQTTATFVFEPPLPRTDGAMYAAMLEAIPTVFPGRTGQYMGVPMTGHRLPDGRTALAVDTPEYLYLAMPVKAEDQGGKIVGMSFWRQIR